MKKLRIGALLAAGALLLTFAGTALATDGGQTNWDGNGYPTKVNCTDSAPGTVLWIFTGDSDSDVVLHLGANTYTGTQMGQGSWHIVSPWFDSAPGGAYVTWTGEFSNGNAVLTISHGCPAESSPSPSTPVESESVPPSESPSASVPVESESPSASVPVESESPSASVPVESESPSASVPVESESASVPASPSGSVEAETGTPQITPPSTDTVSSSSGSSSNGLPMLLGAASLLLIAALVATPSRKRSRR